MENMGTTKSNIKKLYRSVDDKMLEGVCGGIGEYFNVDPTLVRILYVAITVFSGFMFGIITYVVLALIIPKNPKNENTFPNEPITTSFKPDEELK
ncbi:PspC domain-containing protein [Methanococcus voltae]|uniref:Phage shock protein C, PspC n=1 Tax=Methanococcus voltae (strain ATCC BAA-1334 / A3) TaxID=456320 RepID=D7DS14_METV3|nr:PspC domain-containing protein [Methanococcus voltae]MCS3901449.1 phage shock protein C [Methanococcus voltae]